MKQGLKEPITKIKKGHRYERFGGNLRGWQEEESNGVENIITPPSHLLT